MNEIMEKTRELGELIQNSAEMDAYKTAEAEQKQDENAQTLLKEFNLKSMNLARDMQNGKITREEAITKNNEAYRRVIESSDTVKAYVDAKKVLDGMVNQVNQILNYYITGEQPGCSHDCGSCGGCH